MRRLLEDLLPLMLRDAAEHAEYLAGGLGSFEIGEPRKDLLLGLIANAARVIEDQPGFVG